MSNWFENHPVRSIIGHTILVAGVTWAVSTFILQDNRVSLARSELEAQKSLTEQYKSKSELLQRDIDTLRNENAEYRDWLGRTKDAIPALVPRISELKIRIGKLEDEAKVLRATNPLKEDAFEELTASRGEASIDNQTGTILSVFKTTPERTAQLGITFPGKDSPVDLNARPGSQSRFVWNGKKYVLTITEISFIGDTVRYRISPDDVPKVP